MIILSKLEKLHNCEWYSSCILIISIIFLTWLCMIVQLVWKFGGHDLDNYVKLTWSKIPNWTSMKIEIETNDRNIGTTKINYKSLDLSSSGVNDL